MSITLQQASDQIGAGVTYRPDPTAPPEDGVITEVRGRYVLVQYRGDIHAKATAPELLSFLTGGAA
ncbi:hypothetical protein [Janibacter sp. LM]|uniref:hypothetical protein n=1 Tax=Janibacter sp. LM TaxID=3144845 RepID=UPI0031F6C96C